MHGLKSFDTAAITLSGVELAHRIRKRQFALPERGRLQRLSLKELWEAALSPSTTPIPGFQAEIPSMHQFSATYRPYRSPRGRRPLSLGDIQCGYR